MTPVDASSSVMPTPIRHQHEPTAVSEKKWIYTSYGEENVISDSTLLHNPAALVNAILHKDVCDTVSNAALCQHD